jgi:hypothetical protein
LRRGKHAVGANGHALAARSEPSSMPSAAWLMRVRATAAARSVILRSRYSASWHAKFVYKSPTRPRETFIVGLAAIFCLLGEANDYSWWRLPDMCTLLLPVSRPCGNCSRTCIFTCISSEPCTTDSQHGARLCTGILIASPAGAWHQEAVSAAGKRR